MKFQSYICYMNLDKENSIYDSTKQSQCRKNERKKEELGSGYAYNIFPKVIHGQ